MVLLCNPASLPPCVPPVRTPTFRVRCPGPRPLALLRTADPHPCGLGFGHPWPKASSESLRVSPLARHLRGWVSVRCLSTLLLKTYESACALLASPNHVVCAVHPVRTPCDPCESCDPCDPCDPCDLHAASELTPTYSVAQGVPEAMVLRRTPSAMDGRSRAHRDVGLRSGEAPSLSAPGTEAKGGRPERTLSRTRPCRDVPMSRTRPCPERAHVQIAPISGTRTRPKHPMKQPARPHDDSH
jgi:hypothetical protein